MDADTRGPLGTLALATWTRKFGQNKHRGKDGKKKSGAAYAHETDKESARWVQQVQASCELVEGRDRLIHVMVREADAYELLSNLVADDHRFVVRVRVDRFARDPQTLVAEHLLSRTEQAPDVLMVG